MKMRAPAVPLITVDPYFSVWSKDEINTRSPTHQTGIQNAILGTVTVDGEKFCFLGSSEFPVIKEISLDINALYERCEKFSCDLVKNATEKGNEKYAELLWRTYNTMRSRAPMGDWYYADTSQSVSFVHRSIQGGLFLKFLF